MTDIVERLREHARLAAARTHEARPDEDDTGVALTKAIDDVLAEDDFNEAADEIERLRRRIVDLE